MGGILSGHVIRKGWLVFSGNRGGKWRLSWWSCKFYSVYRIVWKWLIKF